LHLDRPIAVKQNIHPRPKLDEPNPLAAGHLVSHFEIKNDASRDQASDLLEDYGPAVAFHSDDVLLVLLRRMRPHGVEKLAALIAHLANHARNRRAVHMDIEDAKKDADPVPRNSARGHHRNIRHLAVSRRNHGSRQCWNLALRITEK